MLVIASPLAKKTKSCLKKKILLRFPAIKVINVVKKVFFKLVFILVGSGSGMIIPDPDPWKTFRIRPDQDPQH